MLVVGPHAVGSDYVRQEWLFALEADKVVTPILRRGDYPLVPGELAGVHCEDFRDDARYAFALANLVRQLNEPIPPLGTPHDVPARNTSSAASNSLKSVATMTPGIPAIGMPAAPTNSATTSSITLSGSRPKTGESFP